MLTQVGCAELPSHMLTILTLVLACSVKESFILLDAVSVLEIFECGHVFKNNPIIEPFKKLPRHLNAVVEERVKL